ncbi:MAG: hypothetical protein LOD92_07815, partial [Bacillales bacterium]
MGILSRIRQLIKAQTGARHNQADNPEKAIDPILQELRREEIEAGLSELELPLPEKRSETGLRREVARKVTSDEDKARFWRAANHEFIYKHILDIGPLAWQPQK